MKFLYYVFTFLSLNCFAQKESSIWYFGDKAGIQFEDNGTVSVLTDSQMSTNEGCATISDNSGNLLFYSNGEKIWNKNHVIMQNGSDLLGSANSSQAVIIVPKPYSVNIYYVFTTDNLAESDGFRFSEVDMSLDNGLGAVTSSKNNPLYTPTCEKISLVKHANNIDYWVISHDYSNAFYCYLVTQSGVSTFPVISHVGFDLTNQLENDANGCMKFSPDGKKIAITHSGYFGVVELEDFDNATGIVSNPLLLSYCSNPYGVEFSPNSKVLYIASNYPKLVQFDLSAADIPNSENIIYNIYNFTSLQLANNGKIYVANYGPEYLSVIENPNIVGLGCGFINNAISLNGRKCRSGLPNFNQSFFNKDIDFSCQNLCFGNMTEFIINSSQALNNTVWDFGDGSTSTSGFHQYATSGNFLVTVTTNSPNGILSKSKQIAISQVPFVASNIQNSNICGNESSTVDLSQYNSSVIGTQSTSLFGIAYFNSIQDVTTHSNILPITINLVMGANTIFVKVFSLTNINCFNYSSFTITLYKKPIANTLADYIVCEQSPFNSIEQFNLYTKNAELLGSQSTEGYSVSYYDSEYNANNRINNLSNIYFNTLPEEIIYARIENNLNIDCYSITQLKLKVISEPFATVIQDQKICSNISSGLVSLELSSMNSLILAGQPSNFFQVKYYSNLNDAQNNNNSIQNSFYNATVYYTISADNNNSCKVISSFKLIQTNHTKAFSANPIFICDDSSNDGIGLFDLSINNDLIIGNQDTSQYSITYHFSQDDANNNFNLLPTNYQNVSNPQMIYARIENKFNVECFDTIAFQIGLCVHPKIDNLNVMITCDDESNDNIEIFNLNNKNDEILGTQLISDYDISYYYSEENAILKHDPLNLNYSNDSNPQTIYVRLENRLCSDCFDIGSFNLIVRNKPVFDMKTTYSICEGSSIQVSAPLGFSGYLWSDGTQSSNIFFSEPGNYSLLVTKDYGDIICDYKKEITVYDSNIAIIKDIVMQDWTDNENSIQVLVSGDGNYEYSLDNSVYQDSNQFNNLLSGEHIVYVKDKKGCGITSETIFILMYPKYFSPNNDGINDLWKINFSNLEPNLKVKIFDRYGKLIFIFDGLNEGWDGTLNGTQLQPDDYWFVIQRENTKQYKGHFSLKR